MKSPLFSVLLPTYNRADVLRYSIESVCRQTYPNFELLVVGDGCTDGTERLMRRLVKKDTRIRWYPFPKGEGFGYGHRNTVMQGARGRYVAFAAHDDLWMTDHLETFAHHFERLPDELLVYTRPLWIHPDGTFVPTAFNLQGPQVGRVFWYEHNEIPAHCVVYDRKASLRVGGWNPRRKIAGDSELWRRILKRTPSKRAGFIPYPTTIHFRAVWRTGNKSWSPHTQEIYEQVQASDYFRRELRLTARTDQDLHRLVWKKVQDKVWVRWLREVSQAILDETAYTSSELETETLRRDIARITSTKGYRLLESLRRIWLH